MALQHVDKKTAPSSAMVSADSVFTTLVTGARTNTRLGVDTPRGALGGMVATISGADMQVVIANATTGADYLFYNDAAGGAFENAPAVASGKIAMLPTNNGDVAFIDVYETRNLADSADLVYAVSDALYASANGLLTNEEEAGSGLGAKVGSVVSVPTTDDPRLGVKLGK